jgi:hypothetical protein
MANALMPIDDSGLAAYQRKHIAFRAHGDTGSAANARIHCDLRMLRPGSMREELTAIGRSLGKCLAALVGAPVPNKEE